MINELNNSNPTELLLGAIRFAGIDVQPSPTRSFKYNEEFSLGLVSPTGEVHICLLFRERGIAYFLFFNRYLARTK